MVKLTPSRIIDLRRELIPIVGEENATFAMKVCKGIHQELGGQAEISAVLEEFKSRNKAEIEVILNLKAEEKIEELKGLMSKEDALELAKADMGLPSKYNKKKQINEVDNMKDFWDRQEDPDEFHPFLKVKSKLTFSLELVDAEAEPRPSIDSFGNDQYIFDVILRGVTPKKALEDVNSEGFPLYQVGREYAFAVKKKGRSMKRFKDLWLNEGPITGFTFMRTGKGFQTDFVYAKV